MKNIYRKIRKHIGILEMVLILVGLGCLYGYMEKQKETRKQEKALQELKDIVFESERYEQEQERMKQELENPIKVMDSIYIPFMVDSLCRYKDSIRMTGFLTMTKYAPSYEKLFSTEKDYYMWVALDKYFPGGQLVKITGIAQSEELVQFHFCVAQNEETLDDMLVKLDSTLNVMQQLK